MADVSYPYAQINASYGDLQSVGFVIYSDGDNGGPEGTDLNSVVAAVRAYLEGLEGVRRTVASRVALQSADLP
ncbi:hypothetical protein ACFXPN_45865 [Streptomyces griseorubiginosus]|uniref:hypothetical protein n=1 Tax=Streptomyces griseorubiginosus TaxID=67304 RepID=UPI0036D1B78C